MPDLPQGQPLPQQRQRFATVSGYGVGSGSIKPTPPVLNQNHFNHVPLDQGSYNTAQRQQSQQRAFEQPEVRQFVDPNTVRSPPQQPGHALMNAPGRDYYDAPGVGSGLNPSGPRMGPGIGSAHTGMGAPGPGPGMGSVHPGMSPRGPVIDPSDRGMGMEPSGPGMSSGHPGMSPNRPRMDPSVSGISSSGPGMGRIGPGMGSSIGKQPSLLHPSPSTKRRQPMSMQASDVSKFHC